MTCKTLLLHLVLGQPNTAVLRVGGLLAERLQAAVVGFAASQPATLVYGDAYIDPSLFTLEREQIERELTAVEAAFRDALRGRAEILGWRGRIDFAPLADHLAQQARCADLVVTAAASGDFFDASRIVDTGALVMQAGRPVLVVPHGAQTLNLGHAMVAWKDTREARRAVADALPLLRLMQTVTVVEIATADDQAAAQVRLADVLAWLARQGITALAHTPLAASTGADTDAGALRAAAEQSGADLIVAGAYGHSRLREWAMGGVSRALLQDGGCCVLLSH